MANEIAMAASLTATKGGATVNSTALSKVADMTGGDMFQATQSVGLSPEAIDLGEITEPAGAVLIKNLDATNFVTFWVEIGATNQIAKLRAGHVMLLEPAGVLYAKADTAPVNLYIVAVEA